MRRREGSSSNSSARSRCTLKRTSADHRDAPVTLSVWAPSTWQRVLFYFTALCSTQTHAWVLMQYIIFSQHTISAGRVAAGVINCWGQPRQQLSFNLVNVSAICLTFTFVLTNALDAVSLSPVLNRFQKEICSYVSLWENDPNSHLIHLLSQRLRMTCDLEIATAARPRGSNPKKRRWSVSH